ncbi:MAG: hypothetical protein C0481_03555 [Phenylobacterium sp.]|uniref:hypothetical protein n=1 Tax=Phenylobacterium sp. TaxID=1871053 RepID=UPI0025E60D6E|nr:hypothetical protein [Phenylobacterium sp.]MBA4010921.1 hypothetical protein [Phenylobacterium sp.]
MNEWPRLFLLLALAGVVVTLLGSAAAWLMDEERRIRRALKRVLKGPAEAVVIARGRGRGAGFNTSTGLMAVAWDAGAWLLIYRLDELMGAEVIVDGQVVARAYRGEPRRALDQTLEHAARVTLRLIFDDPHHPDFDLDLWLAGDETRRRTTSPGDAMQEANRWLARAEAILRRPIAPRVAAGPPGPAWPPVDDEDDANDEEPPFQLGSDERLL